MTDTPEIAPDLLALTADIVAAHVSHNSVAVADLPALITNVHGALGRLGTAPQPEEAPLTPAVSVRASVKPDYLVCLEDGKKVKMLKRYLRTNFAQTPAQYRDKWNLPADYPMVAPNYSEQRRGLARKIGLGRKPGNAKADASVAEDKAPTSKTRRKLSIARPE